MEIKMPTNWEEQLTQELDKDYFLNLIHYIKEEYNQYEIFPDQDKVFEAFKWCAFQDVKVVIIGQDPYHGQNQAHGLSFSVPEGTRLPPSLVNIFKEISMDLQKPLPKSGNLNRWAKQGVLLLNATLTVRAHSPGSHTGKGWEIFTDAVIKKLSSERENLVFMLWGKYAQEKEALIDKRKHLILKSAHPSPFSAHRGFFGQHHFSKANSYLKQHGKEEIDW